MIQGTRLHTYIAFLQISVGIKGCLCLAFHDRPGHIKNVGALRNWRLRPCLFMPDVMGHLVSLDSRFHGNDRLPNAWDSRLLSRNAVFEPLPSPAGAFPQDSNAGFHAGVFSLAGARASPASIRRSPRRATVLLHGIGIFNEGQNLIDSLKNVGCPNCFPLRRAYSFSLVFFIAIYNRSEETGSSLILTPVAS